MGQNGAHAWPMAFKLPTSQAHALLLDRAKAPRLGLLTGRPGRELDRSTGACHELHSNNVQRKTKATTHAKYKNVCAGRTLYSYTIDTSLHLLQLVRQGTGQRAGQRSEQPCQFQTEPCSAFRIDARRGSRDPAR